MSEHIVEINESNAQQYLIEESQRRPVLVDFWADWCGPCKSLMPILEKLANEYAGQFLLAKVNADEQAMIAGQFGVRSLPTVILMKEGQPVDGFMGAQPETAVRELLDKHLPKPWDGLLDQARALMAEDKASEALPLLRTAYEQSGQRSDIGLTLAQAFIALNRVEEARPLVDAVPMVDQDDLYHQVKAQLELQAEAAQSPELESLKAQLENDPDNPTLQLQLALQYSQEGYHREALDMLYPLLQKNINAEDGAVKKAYMDIVASLGKGDPLASEFQRKIYTLLY